MKSDFDTALNSDFRNNLNDNFKEIDSRLDVGKSNIDGKTFSSINERLDAIEWALKALGMPIDGSAKDWTGGN